MKHNTCYFMMKYLIDNYKLAKFKSQWRRKNANNLTVPVNIFPIDKVTVGKYTYGNLELVFFGTIDDSERIEIGNACSIANGVKFLAGGEHDTDCLTMFPYYQKYIEKKHYQAHSKGPIIVEDEVWIGRDCLILSGVRIGKGAVVGAGAVVVKDIPPYSISVGNPAVPVKYRFSNEVITKLKNQDYSQIDLRFISNHPEIFEGKINENSINNILQIIEGAKRLV